MSKNSKRFNILNLRTRKGGTIQREKEIDKIQRDSWEATIRSYKIAIIVMFITAAALIIGVLQLFLPTSQNDSYFLRILEEERKIGTARSGLTATALALETIRYIASESTDEGSRTTLTAIYNEELMLAETNQAIDAESAEIAMTMTAIGFSISPTYTASLTPLQTTIQQIQTGPLKTPSPKPTKIPSKSPTMTPSPKPTKIPSRTPTINPSPKPTKIPSRTPTMTPSPSQTKTNSPPPTPTPTDTPIPPTIPNNFEWSTNDNCGQAPDDIENRVHNLNDVNVQVTGFIKAKPDGGGTITISEVPSPYQNCPAGGWCGPIETIQNHYPGGFQGEIWGTTWVHYQGNLVRENSFKNDLVICSSTPN